MSRSMASGVSALSGIVANSHQTVHFVSPAPSEIPYGGFPLYGSSRLSETPFRHLAVALTRPQWLSLRARFYSVVGLTSAALTASDATHLPSGPLSPPAVMLSASLIAYYDHIRASAGHRGFHHYCPQRLACRRSQFILPSLIPCRRPYSGGSGAPKTSLRTRLGLHPSCRGSATTMLHTPDYVWPH